jgi:hypothetical protein
LRTGGCAWTRTTLIPIRACCWRLCFGGDSEHGRKVGVLAMVTPQLRSGGSGYMLAPFDHGCVIMDVCLCVRVCLCMDHRPDGRAHGQRHRATAGPTALHAIFATDLIPAFRPCRTATVLHSRPCRFSNSSLLFLQMTCVPGRWRFGAVSGCCVVAALGAPAVLLAPVLLPCCCCCCRVPGPLI